MPEPVCGSRGVPPTSSESQGPSVVPEPDALGTAGFCEDDGLYQSLADESLACLSPAVEQLVSTQTRSALGLYARAESPVASEASAENNSQRTAAMAVTGRHFAAGVTGGGQSFYAEGAGMKGARGAMVAELVSGSIQGGAQNEAQVALHRVTLASAHASLEVHTMTAEVHGGVHNPDGSFGRNAGYALNLIGAEATVSVSGNSLTVGLAAGPGAEGSAGSRDADGDGKSEYCFRAGIVNATVGACVEPEGIAEAARGLVERASATLNRWGWL